MYDAVRKTVRRAKVIAVANAPVGNPGDYRHRVFFPAFFPGPRTPGTYKASFRSDIRGTRGPNVVGNLRNNADHAIYVERGRSATTANQTFSSARVPIRAVDAFEEAAETRATLISTNFTSARPGKFIMEDALNDAARQVLGVAAARRGEIGDVIPSRFLR